MAERETGMSLLRRVRQALRRRDQVVGAAVTSIHPEGSLARISAKRWAQLDETTRRRMVHVLRTRLSASERQRITAFVRSQGEEWMVAEVASPVQRADMVAKHGMYVPETFHFTFGMALRNLLRDHGVTDRELPTHNLDDYYARAVEEMVAKEPWPKVVWLQGDRDRMAADLFGFVRHADIVLQGADGLIVKDRGDATRTRVATEIERRRAVVVW